MIKKAICKICGKSFKYDDRTRKGLYCSVSCRYADHSNIIKNSYTEELRKKKSDLAKEQMKNIEQIPKVFYVIV